MLPHLFKSFSVTKMQDGGILVRNFKFFRHSKMEVQSSKNGAMMFEGPRERKVEKGFPINYVVSV